MMGCIAIDMYTNKVTCACSKHDNYQDGDKINTLTFVNLLLVKIFSQP